MIQALKKTLAAFCALTFLSMQCQAQYIVDTNAGGSGTPGTLDYAITNASNLSGAVITFTQSAANGASSSINDTDKVSLTINMGGQNGTLSGVISDGSSAGALIVPDTGKLTLSGYNSYTGGTTISNNAVLSVAIDLNLGGTSGGLTFDGGTLQTTGALSSGRGVTLNAGGGTIDTDGKADMLYGAIGGAGILTVMSSAVDSGKLTLSGANNYNGGTSINWASVQANAAGALGTGAVTMSNASLILGSDQAIGSLTGDSSSKAELDAQLTTGGDNTDTAFAGTISGSGALVKSGSGVFTIASSNNGKTNTYTGGTTVSAGTLGIYADSDLGATAGALTLNGATLRTVGGLTLNSSRVVNLSGGGTIDTYGQSDTIAGGVSGSGGLNVASSAGSGTLTLSGGNSYTGGTTVANTATLAVYSDANLGAASGGLALSGSGATLRTLGNVTLASPRAVTLGSGGGALSGGTIDTYGNADSIAGAISGGGTAGLNVTSTSGSGTLALSGANTYTGGTTVNTGATLAINSDGNLGAASGGLTLSGGTLQTLGSLTLNSSRAVTLSGASKIDTDGNNATVSGVVSGAGLTKIGAGTLTLSGANAYTGATTINAGTLSVANVGNLGSTSGIAFGGGTLQTTAGISSGLAVTLNSGGGTIDTHGQTDTLSGAIGGTGGLTKTGAGTLTLSDASNSYSGGTTINAGTLRIADVHDLGSPTVLSIITFNGGTLETTSGVTISALDTVTIGGGGGTIQTDNQTDTISGLITGTGRLTIVGTGLTLTNAGNNYSGGTVFNGAALTASALGNFGTGGVTLDNSSSLTLTADQALASLGGDSSSTVALNNHALTTGSDGTSTTFAGVISGSGGSLVMNGAGTFTLSGVNTYTGGTTISAGTLAINTDSSLGDASGGLTFNGGTLQTTSALASGRAVTLTGAGTIDTDGNNATLSGLVIGSGRLTKTGAGTLTLTDAGNSYSGGTTINAGILSIASVGALGSPLPGNSLTFNGGTLQTTSGLTYAGAVALNGGGGTIDADGQTDTISGAIGGAGTLTLTDSSGGGTLTFTGAHTSGARTAIIGSGGVHLLAGAQNVLGAGAVSMSGGDLDLNGFNQTIGSLSGDVNSTVELDGKTLTTGADNTSTAFAGVISDGGASGSLVKNGNGTFILSGANAYTGGTTINVRAAWPSTAAR
ncbi:MAG: autotransporter-associated beta strand repeat-containing protein [Elusimicrobia bacterium]|nr:autotransporter-associated beta strand repeat-containing protein [Elusimicrobiota bacterium]